MNGMKPFAKAIVAGFSMIANVVVVALALQAGMDAPATLSLLAGVNAAGVFGVLWKKNEDA